MDMYPYKSLWLTWVIRSTREEVLQNPMPLVVAPAQKRGKKERYHGPSMPGKRSNAAGSKSSRI